MVSPVITPAAPQDTAITDAAGAPASATPPPAPAIKRTLWGLDPFQLYTRFWAAHGVQVVRQGEKSAIVGHAELLVHVSKNFFPVVTVRYDIGGNAGLRAQLDKIGHGFSFSKPVMRHGSSVRRA